MYAQANGTPLIDNTAASAAGEASLSPPQFEGVFQQSLKGPILSEDRSLHKSEGTNFVRAVFDGHGGVPGAAFAEIGCTETEKFFDSIDWNKITPSMLKAMMPGLFRRIDEKCREESQTRLVLAKIQAASHTTGKYYDITRGGTTGTIVFVSFCPITLRRYILTAHVGDSDAAFVCGDVVTKLNAGDHGIDSFEEEKRIEADFQQRRTLAIAAGQSSYSVRRAEMIYNGGSRAFIQSDSKIIPNPEVAINKLGSRRSVCNLQGDLGGYVVFNDYRLAMTRALADFALREVGVIALPTVSVMYLDPDQNGQVVVASDGLWDGIYFTLEQKMASSYPQLLCLSEMLIRSNSIDAFGALAFGQVQSLFGTNYDDITVVVGNVPTHAECLAAHLAAVPESRALPSGVPCNVLHVYDYDPVDYDRDIEEQFPAPVEVFEFRPNWLIYEQDAVADAPVKVVAHVITVADIIGPLMESAKRERANRYGKAPSMRASLPRACKKYCPYYRVNQPRK